MSWVFSALAMLAAVPCAATSCPTADCDPARLARRTLRAARIAGPPPVIDGVLDDGIWAAAPLATDFVEGAPRPAAPASLRSEARVLVDGEAVYVALTYLDPRPERIQGPLARRDDETTSDWAFVEIDSRHDRRTAFSFGVNPRGVQVDGLWFGDTGWDASWNAVWEARRGAARGLDGGVPHSLLAARLQPARGGRGPRAGASTSIATAPATASRPTGRRAIAGWAASSSNFNDLVRPAPARGAPAGGHALRVAARGRRSRPGPRTSLEAGADFRIGLGSDLQPDRHGAAGLRPGRGRSVAGEPDGVRALPGRAAAVLPRGPRRVPAEHVARLRLPSRLLRGGVPVLLTARGPGSARARRRPAPRSTRSRA